MWLMCPDIMHHNEIQLPKKNFKLSPFLEKEKKSDKKIGTFSAKAFKALKARQVKKFSQFCLSN